MNDWGSVDISSNEGLRGGGDAFQTNGFEAQGLDDQNFDSQALDVETGDVETDEAPRKYRIRKGDIEKLKTDRLEGKEKFISIWTHAGKGQPLKMVLDNFPVGAAMAFSEVWKTQLEKDAKNGNSNAALYIDGVDIDVCKRILAWINLCIDEGNDIKFPEIEDANPLEVLIEIVDTANKLKVPELSLQEPLRKMAVRYARKSLIGFEYVERLYDEDNRLYLGDAMLQEAVAASIFEAWWSRELDEPEFDDYCSFLEQMRAEFPKLDEDLNGRFEEKKAFIEKKREERKSAQRDGGARQSNKSHNNGQHGKSSGDADSADGGWGDAAATTVDADDEWGAGGKSATGNIEWGNDGENQSFGNDAAAVW